MLTQTGNGAEPFDIISIVLKSSSYSTAGGSAPSTTEICVILVVDNAVEFSWFLKQLVNREFKGEQLL